MGMTFPTPAQGKAAHVRGQVDGFAGRDRDTAAPWSPFSDDPIARCLAACYQRGYSYGRQLHLQEMFGDIPAA